MSAVYLGMAVFFNVVANAILKYAAGVPEWGTQRIALYAVGLAIGLANTLCYIKALEAYALSTAYPLFMAGSTLLITFVSVLAFSEQISMQKAAGLCAIGIGLALLWKA
jgi:multidrug transporter EmrE-like cation transporter